MFFLRTIFRARESSRASSSPAAAGEMTFLEHLEDLRRTILRMSITALVAMLACFTFAPDLLELLRKPVEQVWSAHEKAHLPADVRVQDWLAAKELARVRHALSPQARALLEQRSPAPVRTLAEAVPLLRAAAVLPAAEQGDFLRQACPPGELLALVESLHASGADLHDEHSRTEPQIMGAFQPGEAFMLSLQLAFFGGVVIAAPLLLYFLLQFIAPGLLPHEKRLLCKSLCWGVGLFLLGCAFAYSAVLPRVLSFFFEYSWSMGIANDWRIGYYISFAAKLIFVFGIIFELPVVIIPLIKLGVLTYTRMRRSRPYAIVGSFGVALLLAPAPDPGTMLIMALPLYCLYELCILVAWRESKRREASLADYPSTAQP